MTQFLGTLEDLYGDFKKLEFNFERIEFLEFYKKKNLPWDIKWDNLIKAWEQEDIIVKNARVAQPYSLTGDEGENFDRE